ncbi:MAG: B12-binding domain-containing radical SAM protein [bacterium]|nr:B12-binding domain-containing radical SAM protein [bacterium]
MDGSETIVLAFLPFWTSLIPPLGTGCLKSYLSRNGVTVDTADANVQDDLKECYDTYFKVLKKIVPVEKQGNFFSIGHEVLRNHAMVHLHYMEKETGRQANEYAEEGTDGSAGNSYKEPYLDLVKLLLDRTFFCPAENGDVKELSDTLAEFYSRLETWLIRLMEEKKPTILGFTVYSDTLPASLFAFQLTRKKYPRVKTVMGGGIFADQLAVGSPNLEIFLQKTKSYIDTIIIGEGEELFLKLVKGELPGDQRVFTRKDAGNKTLDLATVPVPDFSDFNPDFYPYMTTYISRSCPFQCGFCAETVNWGKYRRKKTAQAVSEFSQLYERHGYQLFLVGDSLLNPVATDLARGLIDAQVPAYWDGYLRADPEVCDRDRTLLWRRGGFYRARLGIESGSPRILASMGKKISLQQVSDAVAALAVAGIKTTTYWIMGYPGETEEDFQATLDLVTALKDYIYEAECKPFYYHPSGQVNSDDWMKEYRRVRLYPEAAEESLMLQTWLIDAPPGREETYRRVGRFLRHCKELGIPNPYSMTEIYQADQRWSKMHKNAVPSLVELRDKTRTLDECRAVKKLNLAVEMPEEEDEEFDF